MHPDYDWQALHRDALVIDPRTVLPEQDRAVAEALTRLRA